MFSIHPKTPVPMTVQRESDLVFVASNVNRDEPAMNIADGAVTPRLSKIILRGRQEIAMYLPEYAARRTSSLQTNSLSQCTVRLK